MQSLLEFAALWRRVVRDLSLSCKANGELDMGR